MAFVILAEINTKSNEGKYLTERIDALYPKMVLASSQNYMSGVVFF